MRAAAGTCFIRISRRRRATSKTRSTAHEGVFIAAIGLRARECPSSSTPGCPAGCSCWAPTALAAARRAAPLRRHFEVDAECSRRRGAVSPGRDRQGRSKGRGAGNQGSGHQSGKGRSVLFVVFVGFPAPRFKTNRRVDMAIEFKLPNLGENIETAMSSTCSSKKATRSKPTRA